MRYLLLALTLCSCSVDALNEADSGAALDCEGVCSTLIDCGLYGDTEELYNECLIGCGNANTNAHNDQDFSDLDCAEDCYAAVDSGDADCAGLQPCVVACDPFWI